MDHNGTKSMPSGEKVLAQCLFAASPAKLKRCEMLLQATNVRNTKISINKRVCMNIYIYNVYIYILYACIYVFIHSFI